MERSIMYFDVKGKVNTGQALAIARDRARELAIHQVLVASTHGRTALQAAEVFQGTGVELIAVSISAAFDDMGWTLAPGERRALEEKGVRVLTSQHALADGITEGFFGECTPGNLVANVLRWFSQGMKVAVETSIMALEAGFLAAGTDVIAVAGTDEGADTAIVIRPAFARHVKDVRICEILCKPRLG
jgi:hypothetical protein